MKGILASLFLRIFLLDFEKKPAGEIVMSRCRRGIAVACFASRNNLTGWAQWDVGEGSTLNA